MCQAEDGIRDLVRSRGLGDVYKRQSGDCALGDEETEKSSHGGDAARSRRVGSLDLFENCLLYTSDAADERSSVDLGGRRIIKKKKQAETIRHRRRH